MKLKRIVSAWICFLSLAAQATTFSTDISDLWWNPNESGWGLNVIQQNEVLFLTMFVYGANGQPTWFVGPDVEYQNGNGGNLNFSGVWYQTTGPFHGGAFNPNAVGVRQVGNVTFSLSTITAGTLSYTADGVSVTKGLTRQMWRTNQLAGLYLGGTVGTYTGVACLSPGYQEEVGFIRVTQTTSAIAFTLSSTGRSCTYSGPYTQAGRMGSTGGNFLCTDGSGGTFLAFEIEGSISGFTLRATGSGSGCSWSGRIGGLRSDRP